MQDNVGNLGALAQAIFAGKAVSRLTPGEDTVTIINMRDVGVEIAPRSALEVQDKVNASGLAHLRLQPGDIVMTSRGTIRAAVADAEHAGAIPGANTVVIRLPPHVPARVIAAYLRHPRIVATLMREFVGSTTAGFSVAGLGRLPLVLADKLTLDQMDQMIDAEGRYYAAMVEAAEARRDLALELVMRNLSPPTIEDPA